MDTNMKKVEESFKMIGDWKSQTEQLKVRYPQLTDEDLKYEPGNLSILLKRMETRLKKNREEVVRLIRSVQPVAL